MISKNVFCKALLFYSLLFTISIDSYADPSKNYYGNFQNKINWAKRVRIGEGSYGRVYQVPTDGNQFIAVKLHKPSSSKDKNIEIIMLQELHKKFPDTPHLPRFYGYDKGHFWYSDEHKMRIQCERHAMEYFPSTLHELTRALRKNKIYLPEIVAKKMIYSVLRGVKLLHSLDYIHRDIKPGNILLSQTVDSVLSAIKTGLLPDCRAVITDFGMAKKILSNGFIDPTRPDTPDMVTLDHRPPENCLPDDKQHYGKYTDTWSIGIVFLSLILNRNPVWDEYHKIRQRFSDRPERDQLSLALNILSDRSIKDCYMRLLSWKQSFPGLDPEQNGIVKLLLPHGLSNQGVTILLRMLVTNPSERESPDQILMDNYWDEVRGYDSEEWGWDLVADCYETGYQYQSGYPPLPSAYQLQAY